MTQTNDELRQLIAEAVASADPTLQERIETDREAYLDLIVLTNRAHGESANLLAEAVGAARSAGYSWEAIGKVLGISRQAAQQRFGQERQPDTAIHMTSEVRKLRDLTAFNEMSALNRAGRFGWHSIANGVLTHTLARSNEQWEHDRVLFISPKRKQLEEDGWQQAGEMWFPWVYYARPTGTPAIMEDVSDAYLLHG